MQSKFVVSLISCIMKYHDRYIIIIEGSLPRPTNMVWLMLHCIQGDIFYGPIVLQFINLQLSRSIVMTYTRTINNIYREHFTRY